MKAKFKFLMCKYPNK